MTVEPSQKKPRGRLRDLFRRSPSRGRTPRIDDGPLATPCANVSASSEVIREDTLTTTLNIPLSSTTLLRVDANQNGNADNAELLPAPMPEPASTIDADDDDSAAPALWDIAYDDLKKSDYKLIRDYEEVLSKQLEIAERAPSKETGQVQEHALAKDAKVRREQMKKVLEVGFDIASSSRFGFREKTANVVDIVTTFKGLIDEAVKVSPEASLAWAGVSFFLPMLTNLHTENDAFKKAFGYVTSRAPVYAELEKEVRDKVASTTSSSSFGSESLALAFINLYATVIAFQAKAARRVFGKKAGKALRDAFQWDEWEVLGNAVKDAEGALMTTMRDHQLRVSTKKLDKIIRSGEEYYHQLESALEKLQEIVLLLENQLATGKEQLVHMVQDEEIQKQILESLQSQAAVMKDQEAKIRAKEDQECISHLRTTDPRDDKKRIEVTKGGLLEDSYRWILENSQYQRWRDDQQSRLLWIKGDPGKGKTMLLCGIINELENSMAQKGLLSYFFCQATDDRIKTATAVLRGLLYMLVSQQPSLISYIRKRHKHAGKALFEDANAWVALSEIFLDVLRDPSLNDTYLIVDALDECVTGLPKLLDFIVQTSDASSRVKWIVSSRNWPDIEERLERAGQKVKLSLELNAASVSTAVHFYIQHRVNQLALEKIYNNETRSAVLAYLSSNANDTFLWVALVCQNLGDMPRRKVLAKLKAFPPGLDALYDRMIQKISISDDADLCKRILAFVAIVYRPITLNELTCLSEKLEDMADDLDSVREIVGLCGSFLTIQGSTVYFVHQSAKDFLSTKAVSELFPSGMKEVHYIIFLRSLQFMSKTLQRDVYSLGALGYPADQVEQPDSDPLAASRYSCIYWIDHLCDWNSSSSTHHRVALQKGGAVDSFLRKKYIYWLEALSLCKSMSKGVTSIAKLEALIYETAAAFPLREIVQDAHRFIMYHKWAIESNPLQAYASALVFSPTRSLIRDLFKEEEPKEIVIKPAIQDNWSSCLQTLEGHSDWVNSVAFSHDSTRLASASRDSTVKVWDASSGECMSMLEGHSAPVNSVAFSHDSTRLASASDDNTVKVWDASSGECLLTLEGQSDCVYSVAFSHDSARLASASGDKMVRVWDASSGECVLTLKGHSDWVRSVAFSHDSTRLASASRDKTVKVWDASSGECVLTLKGHSNWVRSVAFSHDSTRLASASRDKTVKIWDASSGECVSTLKAHSDWVWSVTFSHDSTRLASASRDKTVKVWDVSSGECESTLKGHSNCVWSVAFSHDSTWLASASRDNTVKVWDASSSECVSTLEGHSDWVNSVVFSHDSTRLASTSYDRMVKVWDASSGECLLTLEGHSDCVYLVAFSHDSTRLASASRDKTVKVWDASSGECELTLKGHSDLVNSVAFSHDSTRLALTSYDRMVKVWDASSGECVLTLEGHSDCVNSVAFSHDSTRLASASRDKTVKVWDASSGECLQTLNTGKALHRISFDISNSYLQTDVGVIDIIALSSLRPVLTNLEPQSPQYQGLSLSADGVWITHNLENLVWIPSEYRPSCLVVSGNTIGIGVGSGRVWICKVQRSIS